MKRKAVEIEVTDHAVLRWLEREHGLNTLAVKQAIAGIVQDGAELGALNVVLGRVVFFLRERASLNEDARPLVTVVTTRPRERKTWNHQKGRQREIGDE